MWEIYEKEYFAFKYTLFNFLNYFSRITRMLYSHDFKDILM